MGVKRWLLVLLAGAHLLGLGIGTCCWTCTARFRYPRRWAVLTLQFLPRLVRAVLFGGLAWV
jgi:hypothetical protein